MIEPTYRRLDQPAKIGLFSFSQWVLMLLISSAVIAAFMFLPVPHWAVLIPGGYLVFVPGALMALSEGERPPLWRSTRDILSSAISPKSYEPGPGTPHVIWVRTDSKDPRS